MDDTRETGLELDPKYDAAGLDHRRRHRCREWRGADGRAYGRRGAGGDLRHRRGAFLVAQPPAALAKGETSGNVLRVVEMRVDCDQDAVWVIAEPAGPACHTGEPSCFYRRMTADGLERV